jgi:chromosome segregation protein
MGMVLFCVLACHLAEGCFCVKLKSIELQGFKSFVDRTKFDFDEGITAILGPNGCGKSNVVDAVRWVLGEQSAKTLRGGNMADVIFKGTTKRRPVGMAEVTLTFENEDRGLPVDFGEVSIKRKVTRDGGSDYFLNGSLCRLKDLKDLFYDSGVNNTSYSIIEESMIKSILNENNTELRHLLEEGSGITKYKARRKETQRKLDRTQNDLTRLYDLLEEIGKEVRSLQRQVGKARRHQKLYREIRGLDLLVAGKRHGELNIREANTRESLEEYRTEAEAGVGELAELQAKMAAARPAIDEREEERRQLEDSLSAFEEELKETERQVLVLQHRIDETQRRINDNQTGVQEAETQQKNIEGQIERLAENLSNIETELEGSDSMLAERSESLLVLEDRLETDRAALDEATRLNLEFIENDALHRSHLRELQVRQENRRERMTTLAENKAEILREGQEADTELAQVNETRLTRNQDRTELLEELADIERRETTMEVDATGYAEDLTVLNGRREAARSTSDLLQRLHQEYEGFGKGPKEILKRYGKEDRVTGALADLLQVDSVDAGALAALLAENLDAVVVDGVDTALSLVQELTRESLGSATFLCGQGFSGGNVERIEAIGGGRLALDVVTGPGMDIQALRNLLARTVIFTNDQEAADAASGYAGQEAIICVSQSGLLVRSDGSVRGGQGEGSGAGILGRKGKLEELLKEITVLDEQIDGIKEKASANRTKREELRETLIAGRGRLNAMDQELGNLKVKMAQLEHRRDSASSRAEEMEGERVRLAEETAHLGVEEEELTDLLAVSGRNRENSTTDRDELRQRVTDAEMQRDEARSETEEMRLMHMRRQGQKRETETALDHLRQRVSEQFSRRERLTQEIEMGRENMVLMGEELVEKRDAMGQGMEERERRRSIVNAAKEGIQVLHQETAGWVDRIQVIEKRRGGFVDQAHEMETALATLEIKRNNLEERIEEQYKGRFNDLMTSVNDEDLPAELEKEDDTFQLDQAADLLADRRGKLNSLGPINHLALEEYDVKKERLDFLEAQRVDVESARDDLVKAITEINRTAKKRFVQTFEEVRRNYIAVFQTLFKGGRADLSMVKTDDPLESHIVVKAQPTGKVIDTVSLLSGGERCLTALSLLFAVYLVKPSPFCVLDEADAPLDDANIGRFVNMLREFSRSTQFLVITHNKLTMETANHLYGVTMMEPGCSNIVSVSFHDVASTQNDKELGNLIAQKRLNIDSVEEVRIREESKGQERLDFNVALEDKDVVEGEVQESTQSEDPEDPDKPNDGSMEASE